MMSMTEHMDLRVTCKVHWDKAAVGLRKSTCRHYSLQVEMEGPLGLPPTLEVILVSSLISEGYGKDVEREACLKELPVPNMIEIAGEFDGLHEGPFESLAKVEIELVLVGSSDETAGW